VSNKGASALILPATLDCVNVGLKQELE